MILGIILNIIAAIIAANKGFKPLRWLLALGIIGFVTVLCLSSAKKAGIAHEEAQRRATKANQVGAWMAWINIGLGVVVLFIGLASNAR